MNINKIKYYTYCRIGNKENLSQQQKKEQINENRNNREVSRKCT